MAAGVRSLLAFWIGGAASPRFTAAPTTPVGTGGDDEIDYYEENRRKRLARIKADDDALIRIIVTGVTKGFF